MARTKQNKAALLVRIAAARAVRKVSSALQYQIEFRLRSYQIEILDRAVAFLKQVVDQLASRSSNLRSSADLRTTLALDRSTIAQLTTNYSIVN